MEHLISAFLMQHKVCTLPQVGTLRIKAGSASVLTAEKMINGPVPEIEFDKEDDIRQDGLVNFIADERGITPDEAATDLSAFCSSVQQLFGNMEVELPGTGRFFSDAEGILNFRQNPLPENFMPPVPAQRVVHPGSSHIMKVGDNEVSSSRMPEIISETSRSRRYPWWIAAIVIFLVSAGAISYYLKVSGPAGQFGNTRKTAPAIEPVLYRVP